MMIPNNDFKIINKIERWRKKRCQNIKKELTDFLKVKFNTDKKQEKQAERIKLAQNLGNIMIIIGFIVGLVLYVGENEKKKRSDYIVEESHNTNAAEDSLTQAQGGNINAQQFLFQQSLVRSTR
ncbi:hypothetical protein C9374_014223 [Naegleria lovaniensis]|uniref:Uncharacterized protein n=1 Tax=Naegleria lovaniensis TaxID=51637 RepID=A0AA88G5P5_NAELO|nr:uncharacterized protein C9374_014223 [Naegleria lovaniensis]KAG2370808.1 hypothetical protein C9374_014223 [Naegleria lovaniensis]